MIKAAPIFAALLASTATAADLSPEETALAARVEAQMDAYVLRHEDASIREIAHPDYMLVLAPGVLESLAMIDGTASNIDMERWDQTTLDVRVVGDTAVVTTRVDAEGTVRGKPFPSRLLMTHVFAREDEDADWRLLQRTMTPILPPDEMFDRMAAEALKDR